MTSLTAIRDALAGQIENKTGLRCDGQARDQVTPPCAVVLPGQPYLVYGATMDEALAVNLAVLLIISDAAPAEMTQRALDAYLSGPGSVPDAIGADPSLSGAASWAVPVSVTRYGRVQYAGTGYFGASLAVACGAS